jgi:hypothetical protein
MTEPAFTEEEIEFFASHGMDVGRRERLEQIRAAQRRLWRWVRAPWRLW